MTPEARTLTRRSLLRTTVAASAGLLGIGGPGGLTVRGTGTLGLTGTNRFHGG